jgi:hypothetical protein
MSDQSGSADTQPQWASPIDGRRERANYYFEKILEGQREWYSDKAGSYKRRHLFFAIAVIVLGAVITVLQAIEAAAWVRYLTAALGALVAVLRAVDTLLRPGETWQGYRKASENMKREYRLYLNYADVYHDAPDEDAAYRLLVERVETVLAEEQQLFWQFHAKTPAAQPPAEVSEPPDQAPTS